MVPPPSRRMAQGLALLQSQAYHLLAAGGALTAGAHSAAHSAEDWPLENRVSAARMNLEVRG